MGQPSQKYTFFHLSLDESQHIGMKFLFLRTQGAGTLCVRHAGTSECCALEWSLGYDKTETEAADFRFSILIFWPRRPVLVLLLRTDVLHGGRSAADRCPRGCIVGFLQGDACSCGDVT